MRASKTGSVNAAPSGEAIAVICFATVAKRALLISRASKNWSRQTTSSARMRPNAKAEAVPVSAIAPALFAKTSHSARSTPGMTATSIAVSSTPIMPSFASDWAFNGPIVAQNTANP